MIQIVGCYNDARAHFIKLDKENFEYNFNLGICYLRTNKNKQKAAKY